ncbi:GTP diphosphokinase [Litorilinea aerophila]|nr:GTP diphosphokinase [Litorilinea aerophila]GIV76814.1 MAG: GTP pyrophosphokinase [Litorilinea sp.]
MFVKMDSQANGTQPARPTTENAPASSGEPDDRTEQPIRPETGVAEEGQAELTVDTELRGDPSVQVYINGAAQFVSFDEGRPGRDDAPQSTSALERAKPEPQPQAPPAVQQEAGRPATPLLAALQKLPPLPTADRKGTIQIQPTPEELQAMENLLQRVPASFTPADRELLLRAYLVASYAHREQRRHSGEPYVLHPIAVATILAELRLDVDTLAAGLLHDVVEDTQFDLAYLREYFGGDIANLVDGVTKLKRINELSNAQQGIADAKAESLRKMFLAMVDDVRVVIIKLADRLHNMRTLGSQKKHKQKRIARETLDIFAPLANRLGIWQIKWELEDLSFRYLEPNTYRELAKAMQQKREEREKWVARIKRELEELLAKAGIPAEVSGRPKHIYSIYRKMKRKDVDFDQIYDIHGFRIIVETEAQCYAALGVVHSNYRPIPGEFDDYIANPKDNMYRSLHTAVLSKRSGKPMEIQIRTREMHEIAEYGIAAHWQYKEQKKHDARFQEKIAWLRQLMEWRQEVTDAREFVDGMKTDVFNDRVYVFTPQGDVIDLPAGSTPIDFAYAIHTELGHRCRGANIRGRLVPLDYKLQNGDQVTIIAAKRGGPSRDWLNPNLEYVATQRARSKIRAWLRKQGREENIQRGRQMLEKEMKRLAINESFESMAKLFNYDKVDDFLAAIGYGDINSQHLAQKVLEKERRERERARWEELEREGGEKGAEGRRRSSATDGFRVQGVEGLLTHLGRCCNPVPGDAIVGYVTKGRGVTIHRTVCPNVANIVRRGQENRLIDVQWAADPEATFPVSIQVSAYDRSGLMRDVAALVADEHINMISVEAVTGQKDNLAVINATLEIRDAAQLTRILTKIDRLPNVVEARRKVS